MSIAAFVIVEVVAGLWRVHGHVETTALVAVLVRAQPVEGD
jgi:hypothetical protein